MKSYRNAPRPQLKAVLPTDETSQSGSKRRYVAHSLDMRQSPAWCGLPDNARRVLDRLEVEHMLKGGAKNGELIVTYDDFVQAGIRRGSIKRALMEAAALGFLRVTRQGYAARMEVRVPSLYRLTYVRGTGEKPPVTNDWLAFKTDFEVREVLKGVLAELEEGRRPPEIVSPGLRATV